MGIFDAAFVQVRALKGTSFGHFGAMKDGIKKEYGEAKDSDNFTPAKAGCHYKSLIFGRNDVKVARTSENYEMTDNQQAVDYYYKVEDYNTQRTYSSKYFTKQQDEKRVKMDYISFGNYKIYDKNQNGEVDDEDIVTYSGYENNQKVTKETTVGKILSKQTTEEANTAE